MIKRLIKSAISKLKSFLLGLNEGSAEIHIGTGTTISGSRLHGILKTKNSCIIREVELMGNLTIGRNTTLWGPGIGVYGKVSIGSFCSIARFTSFYQEGHDYRKLTTYYMYKNVFNEADNEADTKGPIIVGSDVWIGSGVSILSGVSIGNGAIIAANSVVTKDIEAYSISAGNPAKHIKYRFEREIIDRLLEIEWWNWNIEKIMENKHLFKGHLSLGKLDEIK